jgi:hypothetical protein
MAVVSAVDVAVDDVSAMISIYNDSISNLNDIVSSMSFAGSTLTLSGTTRILGSLTIVSALSVADSATFSGTVGVASGFFASSTATITSGATLSSTLTVASAATFSSTGTFTSTLTASANLNVVASLCVSGDLSVAGSALISGDLAVGGNISFTDIQIQGILSHTGSQIGFYDAATASQFSSIGTVTDNTNTQAIDSQVNSAITQGLLTTNLRSPGAAGTFFFGGYYLHATSHANFPASIAHGTATRSYAAHFFVVTGDSAASDANIVVSGTSIDDEETRTAGDTETIVITAGASNRYFETTKKWLGQVTAESAGAGSAINVNYGFAKYWDNNNQNFTVIGFEAVWLGGGNDTGANLILHVHNASGWNYNAGDTASAPVLKSMRDTHVTEVNIGNGENGSWKVCGLAVSVNGAGSEGIIWSVVTTGANTFEIGNFQLHFHAVNSTVDSAMATLTQTTNAVTSALRGYGLVSA